MARARERQYRSRPGGGPPDAAPAAGGRRARSRVRNLLTEHPRNTWEMRKGLAVSCGGPWTRWTCPIGGAHIGGDAGSPGKPQGVREIGKRG